MSCGSGTPLLNAISLGGFNLAAAEGCGAKVCTPVKRTGPSIATYQNSYTGGATSITLLNNLSTTLQPVSYASTIVKVTATSATLNLTNLSISKILSIQAIKYDTTNTGPGPTATGFDTAVTFTTTQTSGTFTVALASLTSGTTYEFLIAYVPL